MRLIMGELSDIPSNQVTVKDLYSTSAGAHVGELIRTGIKNGFLNSENIAVYLKDWAKELKDNGTCYGESSTALMSFSRRVHKNVINTVDVIAFQLLVELDAVAHESLKALKNFKEFTPFVRQKEQLLQEKTAIVSQMRVWRPKGLRGNRTAHRKLTLLGGKKRQLESSLKEVKRKMDRLFLTKKQDVEAWGEAHGYLGMAFPSVNKTESLVHFHQKISSLSRALIEEKTEFRFKGEEEFSVNQKQKFMDRITALANDKTCDYLLRVCFLGSKKYDCNHSAAFFIKPSCKIYDAGTGLIEYRDVDEFLSYVKESYLNNKSAYMKELDFAVAGIKFELFKK